MTSSTQIYIGDLTRSVVPEDLRYEFRSFGRIRDFSWKGRYAFIEYEEATAAAKAVKEMNDVRIGGGRICVQAARTEPRAGRRGDRSPRGRGPSPNDKCFKCEKLGHW